MTSKIKVDNISDQNDNNIINESGDVITVGAAGDTVAVAGNIVKSNALQASDGGNIVSQSGTTITLGASGDTIALSAGASQTGFGRTGTVDWNTTPKTATFTAVSGDGFFANTTGGAFTMNLPAGSAGAIVSVADYAGTWQTNNLTVSPNGTDKIGSVNADVTLNTEGQSVTFVYVDSTQGWINTMDSTSNERGNSFLEATGGTITTSGNDKIHTFTGPGTFTVTNTAGCATQNVVSYLVVAGGGGTGSGLAGGGGAGGFREVKSPVTPYTASPLDGYPSAPNRVTVTATAFPITVGAGGATNPADGGDGSQGSNSIFSTVTSTGGGFGAGYGPPGGGGGNGGSGGGGGGNSSNGGGSGNTPPVSPPQGNGGGTGTGSSPGRAGGGGGGASGGGGCAPGSSKFGNGGHGHNTAINPATGQPGTSPTNPSPAGNNYYAGGGGGNGDQAANACNSASGRGGVGGGGNGREGGNNGTAGTANSGGGGGGGGGGSSNGSVGGSGIVIIRYKFQ